MQSIKPLYPQARRQGKHVAVCTFAALNIKDGDIDNTCNINEVMLSSTEEGLGRDLRKNKLLVKTEIMDICVKKEAYAWEVHQLGLYDRIPEIEPGAEVDDAVSSLKEIKSPGAEELLAEDHTGFSAGRCADRLPYQPAKSFSTERWVTSSSHQWASVRDVDLPPSFQNFSSRRLHKRPPRPSEIQLHLFKTDELSGLFYMQLDK
ncbi:hypothetical protein DPMN_077694 [Dreissena polymorpha]|uniref:Uncharacterized protein n=1 Tax=Dreissena polymorpha TaxID=45954 RepID=A0A9D3YPA9_DREPO|nr:hypothetical protein DPMN_077694 [Dreissena polymorpha]